MNKISKYIGFCTLLLLVFGCSNNILLQRIDSDKPVVVIMNNKIERIVGIKYPFNLVIYNKSFSKKDFSKIIYEYGFCNRSYGIELYRDNKKISNNQLKVVKGKNKALFQVYSLHAFDTTKLIHKDLKLYLEKMLELNQDTLCIGTVAEFKEKHSELFKMLTENDTISIRYLKNENSGLGERIAIPANW